MLGTQTMAGPVRAAEDVETVTVEVWRDHRSRALPGTSLGRVSLAAPWGAGAAELYRSGGRCVRLPGPVRLCADAGPSDARALAVVRELTALGAAVRWTARCEDGCVRDGALFHLFPPAEIEGAGADAVAPWRAQYRPCLCVDRRGPGFVEIRDRRRGALEILTLDETEALAVLDELRDGAPVASIPSAVRELLAEADLITERAGRLWWLPTRAQRWPTPSMAV